jgi:hypothetical protein
MRTEPHPSPLDRLEARVQGACARIEEQDDRIDYLYRVLEGRGILPEAAPEGEAGDAFFDELVQVEDAPFACKRVRRPVRRRRARLHVGSATGV